MYWPKNSKAGNWLASLSFRPMDSQMFTSKWRRIGSGPKSFRSEAGAVTTDWLVLTAAVLLLGLAASAQVAGGTKMASNDVKKCLKIQGNLLKKDISHKKRLKRSARRCGRL